VDPTPILDVLPRGRHRLTREQVVASQRGRLLVGIAEVVAERGYAHTSVADVLKRVRVSRETFYEHFTDKQDCFLAAFNKGDDLLESAVREATGPRDLPAMERFERALTAYLELMASEPAIAKTALVESYAAGPEVTARRFEVQAGWIELFSEILTEDERWRALPDPLFTCQLLIGGVGTMVTAHLAAGNHEALPGLRTPVLALLEALLA
jgi:AcrR family transcriptional regulator